MFALAVFPFHLTFDSADDRSEYILMHWFPMYMSPS